MKQSHSSNSSHSPVPPFSFESATLKVRAAENAWNTRQPKRIALAYSQHSRWRNRDLFITGRDEIIQFLERKWQFELEYRLIKDLWAYGEERIAVRFVYEWQHHNGTWFRSHGNENWLFDKSGLMSERHASINDIAITAAERLFHWPLGERPIHHPGLAALGL